MQRRKLGLATLLLGGIMGGAAALQMGGGVRLAQAELVCTNPNDPDDCEVDGCTNSKCDGTNKCEYGENLDCFVTKVQSNPDKYECLTKGCVTEG